MGAGKLAPLLPGRTYMKPENVKLAALLLDQREALMAAAKKVSARINRDRDEPEPTGQIVWDHRTLEGVEIDKETLKDFLNERLSTINESLASLGVET